MFKFDSEFLAEVGLSEMPEEEKGAFLEHLQEELEMKIGRNISEGMSEAQMEEFEKIIDSGDDISAMEWLKVNQPNYVEIVKNTVDEIKDEIREGRAKVLG